MSDSAATAYRVRLAASDVTIEIVHRRPGLRLRIDGQLHAVVENPLNGDSGARGPAGGYPTPGQPDNTGAFELTIDGTVYHGWRYVTGNEVHIRLGARTYIVTRAKAGSVAEGATGRQHELRADIPGVVVAIHCEVGQTVDSGDPLLTIESMKLQATLLASHPAVVERVHTGVETAFERGALLVSFAQPNVAP